MSIQLRNTESPRTLLRVVGPHGESTIIRKNALCKLLDGLEYEYTWKDTELVIFVGGKSIELETGRTRGNDF